MPYKILNNNVGHSLV